MVKAFNWGTEMIASSFALIFNKQLMIKQFSNLRKKPQKYSQYP